ncbi:nucleotidyltransferase family protein [Inconstantimicrobium mannanitabidum]|uniref:Uncharacterized protein n=1 Tax=Inconstantimicrobium mannanitabidum TaxID=1604901 RepID=A0ACB5R810_9CLOT|nr:nucleotidyltransferase family protein [Clostridium sp. TW13]GKX65325.1 hypothetical protein rsdtw13_05830 [Clostridium sp. TW13]
MNIEGIVLAAGLSSRMKKYKMSLMIGNKTVIERCIESMYDVCSRIIVVGGYNYDLISEILKPYRKVKVILNSNYMEGMFSSVKTGLKQVTSERFLLIPGDYAVINKSTYGQIIQSESDIVSPTYRGENGHPILIKSTYIDDILYNKSYESLRNFIEVHKVTSVMVEDQGILMDIDNIEDYNKVKQYFYSQL